MILSARNNSESSRVLQNVSLSTQGPYTLMIRIVDPREWANNSKPIKPLPPQEFRSTIYLLQKPIAVPPDLPDASMAWKVQFGSQELRIGMREAVEQRVSCKKIISNSVEVSSLLRASFLGGLATPRQLKIRISWRVRLRAVPCSKGPINGFFSPKGNFFTRSVSGFCELRGASPRRFMGSRGANRINTNRIYTLILSFGAERVPGGNRG